ncbi:leucine-rich repeat-containing protein 15-like [Athalia rosae]|uniref:leucine-rich repeat-containing protein 15-like n=1 Tax=Athalia rosae TaxID=37344 RepID=UPI0020339524|nr:leucine-rich repeat-containing protein 15-like [Athalia rosae]
MWNTKVLLVQVLLAVGISAATSLSSAESSGEDSSSMSRECPLEDQVNLSLNLGGIGISHLPDGFIQNEFVTRLNLDGNRINHVTSATFSHLPRLRHLSLADNMIPSLDLGAFAELKNLETLNLNDNCRSPSVRQDITFVRSDFMSRAIIRPVLFDRGILTCTLRFDSLLPRLTHLFVENNDLEHLSFVSGGLPNLTELHLCRNPMLDLNEEEVSNLKKFAPALNGLHFTQSCVHKFDASLLPNLSTLRLDGNDIQSVCRSYCEGRFLKLANSKLEKLSLRNNTITKMEVDSFSETPNLVTLDLSRNFISEIRNGTFDNLQSLRFLYLQHNNILTNGIRHAFGGLVNLEILHLESNELSTIAGDIFSNLASLKQLTLNYTGISSLDNQLLSELSKLEVLSLAGNDLSMIPEDALPTSGSLKTLNLNNNQFTNIENIRINKMPNLRILSLTENPLAVISARWFSKVPETMTLILQGNESELPV